MVFYTVALIRHISTFDFHSHSCALLVAISPSRAGFISQIPPALSLLSIFDSFSVPIHLTQSSRLGLRPRIPTPIARTLHSLRLTHRNCCWNSITTVTRVKTNRFFESSPQALPLCYTVMEEVVSVARAKGMTVPDDTVSKLIKQCTDVKTGLPVV